MTHRASKPAFSAAIADAPSCPAVRSRSEKGYAYLMALFLVVTLMVASQIAVRNLVTEGRRQHEDEMIWRGQQYVRAIRLYYRKTGHYPSTLDDLKKGMPELHFLRYAAYRDPMKKDDGAWRFIYVNAAGQIIGSVKYATLQQMAILDMNGGAIPGAKPGDPSGQPGVPASSLADQSSSNSSDQAAQNPPPNGSSAPASAASTPPSSPDNSQNAASNPQNPASPQSGQNPQSASPSPTSAAGTPAGIGGVNTNLSNQSLAALAALKPTGPVDGPVLGGFLTGVGSSVDKASIRLYNGGKKYNQWEFIWNPVEDQAKALQQGMSNPQGTLPGQPGQAIGGGPAGTSIFGNSGPQAAPGAAASPNPGSAPASNPLQPGSTPQ
jgi:hypothetical protein